MRAVVWCLALAGCVDAANEIRFMDDTWNHTVKLSAGFDGLSFPYVPTSRVRLELVRLGGTEEGAFDGWTFTSDDPSVLEIVSQDGAGAATLLALGDGTATIQAFDPNGRMRRDARLSVATPDALELAPGMTPGHTVPAGEVFATLPDDHVRAVLLMSALGHPVYGVPEGLRGDGLELQLEINALFPYHPGLLFRAEEDAAIVLDQGGEEIARWPVEVVPPSEIASVTLDNLEERAGAEGEPVRISVLAEAEDGTMVYGVPCDFSLDGEEPETADGYYYVKDSAQPMMLQASDCAGQGLGDEIEVHAAVGGPLAVP